MEFANAVWPSSVAKGYHTPLLLDLLEIADDDRPKECSRASSIASLTSPGASQDV